MPPAENLPDFPDPAAITAAAQEVLHSADYALDIHPEQLLFTRYMAKALDYVWEHLRPLLESSQNYLETSPVMYYTSLTICLLILAGIFGDLIYSLYLAAKRNRAKLDLAAQTERAATAEELWSLAEQAAADDDFLTAIRGAWQATLWRLENGKIQPATTNRQYLRRFAHTPAADNLRQLINLVENKWYGGELCEPADWQTAKKFAIAIAGFTAARIE